MSTLVTALITDAQFADIEGHWHTRKNKNVQRDKIHPLENDAFVDVQLPACASTPESRQARAVLDTLLDGDTLSMQTVKSMLFPVLTYPSETLLRSIRRDVQIRLDAFYEALTERQRNDRGMLSDDVKTWAKCRLNNILSYAAFFEYHNGAQINLPVIDDNGVRQVSYTVNRMPLTNPFLSSPYCAYGLEPVHDKKAPSQLLFMGTTYPGSSGFLWTLLADTFPFASVGSLLYHFGRQSVNKWINRQNNQVLCHGQSLGGSLALMFARKHPTKVHSYALVPAGSYGRQKGGDNVTVIYGGNDPVTLVGNMPEKAEFLYVLPPKSSKDNPNQSHIAQKPTLKGALACHALGLAGHQGAQLFRVDDGHMIKNHNNRKFMNFMHGLSWAVMFPFILVAFVVAVVVRPVLLLVTSALRALCMLGRLLVASFSNNPKNHKRPTLSSGLGPSTTPQSGQDVVGLEQGGYTPQQKHSRDSARNEPASAEPPAIRPPRCPFLSNV